MAGLSLFAVISSSEIGGAERHYVTLLRALSEEGIEVSAAYSGSGPMVEEYRRVAARAWRVDMSSVLDPTAVHTLCALMRDVAPDIVHTHLWNADVIGGQAARRARIPAVSTVHGAYHLPIGGGTLGAVKRQVLSRSYRVIYRRFNRIIAVSRYVKDDLAERSGLRLDRNVIEVVNPGLDPVWLGRQGSSPAFERATSIATVPARIVNLANFHLVKGQEWILRAMPFVLSRLPGTECVFIGDGPERGAMAALASRLGLGQKVTFTGTLPDPSSLMAESQLCVFAPVSEGFGLGILEAWSLGLPVVATRVGGISEIIEDNRTGLLVPPKDPAALGEGIIRILSDPHLARRLAAAGFADVHSRHSVRTMASRTASVYRTVLAPVMRP